MKNYFSPVGSLLAPALVGMLLAGGCSERNPAFTPDQGIHDAKPGGDGLGHVDLSIPLDGPVKPTELPIPNDLKPGDALPWPDSKPVKCDTNADCNDNITCTTDSCTPQKVCSNKLQTNYCFIAGKCYLSGIKNPVNDCQICFPTTVALIWTNVPDNTYCTADALTCTNDVCLSGQCTHKVATGCVINNTCVAEGAASPSDVCSECISTASTTAYTYAAGKPCTATTGLSGGMCVAKKCMGWASADFEPVTAGSTVYSTALHGVAYISTAAAVWAAGEYRLSSGGTPLGVLVKAQTSITPAMVQVLATNRLWDIHYRLAVGENGEAWFHSGTWAKDPTIGALNYDRYGVWGATVGNQLVFFLAGDQSTPEPGVMRCTKTFGPFLCGPHTGFENPSTQGAIFGTATSAGAQGPLWSVTVGSNEPEDIYYHAGTGTTWSRSDPHGCQDTQGGTTACSNTNTQTNHIGGSGPSDVWVVGTSGMILSYDGSKWSKVTGAFTSQTAYDLTAVYADATEKLVTVAAEANGTSGHYVRLFNYNKTLKKWYGPVTISVVSSWNAPDQINDINGQGYTNLWAVGLRRTGSSGSYKTKGWMLQLK